MSYFITLEGPDGGGKTSQARWLVESLSASGYQVLHTREPGGTPIGDQIREVLTRLENESMLPRTEFLLFSASRSQLVEKVIRPHLEQGGIVVCDRYYDSSLAYQGYGHGLDQQVLKSITEFATGGLSPDLTLLLDLPVEQGLARRQRQGDWNRLDGYQEQFHQRVRQGFLSLAEADPQRWVWIDASRDEGQVRDEIQRVVGSRLAELTG